MLYFEAFGKKHPEYKQANPAVSDPDMLFNETALRSLLQDFTIHELREGEQKLSEGLYHRGTGWVLQVVAGR